MLTIVIYICTIVYYIDTYILAAILIKDINAIDYLILGPNEWMENIFVMPGVFLFLIFNSAFLFMKIRKPKRNLTLEQEIL